MTESSDESKTYVTRTTAGAPGAIAVLRIWGANALSVADRLFRPKHGGRGLAASQPGELRLGWFGLDEVVALIVPPTEKKGPIEVEIQGHGSPPLVQTIIQLLANRDVTPASHEEYLKAHGVKWLERLAEAHLGKAGTSKAAELLYVQRCGALRRELVQSLEKIESGQIAEALSGIDLLLATASWGERLSGAFQVALAGVPNVGKSTLVNALAGFERVLVSPIPGTTRDLVDVALTIDGWAVLLTDMAGLRDQTADMLEAEGIALARRKQHEADLVLRMIEAGQPVGEPVYANEVVVITKADLKMPDMSVPEGAIAISAATGQGLEMLMERMIEKLLPQKIRENQYEIAIVFDAAIEARLIIVRDLLVAGHNEDAKSAIRSMLEL